MTQVHYIKDLYENKEKSLREISRITGHSFQTVQKYAYREDWSEEASASTAPERYPILGKYIPIIDQWLEEDQRVPRKQRHTRWRIYCRLRDEHGFRGSYSSVKRYVSRKKAQRKEEEGYLPLEQEKACCQADFGEHLYYDAKKNVCKGYALVLSFPYSNHGILQSYLGQNRECLLTGLQRMFEHIGGVPRKIRFDNMPAIVSKLLPNGERVLTDDFIRFMLHYGFEAEFCNPASGNEKGHVENKVGYSRRNYLVPVPTITSFEEFNEELWKKSEKDAERLHYKHKVPIKELWEEEKKSLKKLPEHPFPVFRYESATVNKVGFVTIETNKYGLSPALGGKIVQTKIYFDRIEFYYERKLVGSYRRSYERNKEICDWTQYVDILRKKPGAAPYTSFFRQMPEQWQKYLKEVTGKERKSALQLLSEIVRDGNAELCDDALLLAYENGRTDTDSVRQCYYMIAKKEHHPAPLQLTDAPTFRYKPDLSVYDDLIGGGSNA